jgi:hypothetical protein
MKKLPVIAPDGGINKDTPIFLIPDRSWSDGRNVRFGKGYVEKVKGYKPFLNFPPAWAAETAYSAGAYVVPTVANNHVYKCTTEGVSGTSEPPWTTGAGDTINDGTVAWKEVGVNKLSGVLMAMDNYYKYNGDNHLLAITTTSVFAYDPENNVLRDITGATPLHGTTEYPVVTENAQNYFVFTNGVDPVKYWDGEMASIENLPGLWAPDVWQASTAYNEGDYVRPPVSNGLIYRCTSAGASGGVQPTWPTSGMVADGTVVWSVAGSYGCEPAPGEAAPTFVRCKTLFYFKNFLLLGNTIEDGNRRPQRIRWSCLGDITRWRNVENDTNQQQAGFGDLSDDVSWVQAMRPLGDYVVVYKERAIQLINYVGGSFVWNKWPAIIGTGALSSKALVDLGDEHIFVGNDNIYSFNGRDPAIAGDDIAKEFFRILDPDKYELITGFFIEEIPKLLFAFVSTTSPDGYPDKAISYNTDTKAWSIRDLPMTAFGYYNRRIDGTWDEDEETWDSDDTEWDGSINLANAPINLSGDANGNIFVLEGNSFNGVAIDGFLTSKLFDMGAPDKIKRLLRIQFMISREGPYNLTVHVGAAANVDEPVTWYGPYNMSLDRTYPPWVDVDISARHLCVKLGTLGADKPFRLTGYILYYELRGDV